MAKLIDKGSAKPDDPIYSGGPQVFSPRALNPSSTSSAAITDGATRAELPSTSTSQTAAGETDDFSDPTHPMRPAIDAIEAWLAGNFKDDKARE